MKISLGGEMFNRRFTLPTMSAINIPESPQQGQQGIRVTLAHIYLPVQIAKIILTPSFPPCKAHLMPKPRLIIPHNSDGLFPDLAIYHATSRVVHRQFLFCANRPAIKIQLKLVPNFMTLTKRGLVRHLKGLHLYRWQ